MKKREFHPPHIYENNASYFITARIAHHQKILGTDTKRVLVRDVLKEAIKPYGIRLYAWVILANHYHLLLETSDIPIYKFIKRLHGDSAIQLNKLDNTPGRQVWYQYWDRFPRHERDFWAYFNYIHINPIKHGYVQISDGVLVVEGKQIKIVSGYASDVHQCLAQYPHSSYHYYVREYGEEFLTDTFAQYPIPDYFEHDS
ncbi:MAG: transposase [Chloroflexota bacterium]|nr:transposase [Chloroflexota bacterium]